MQRRNKLELFDMTEDETTFQDLLAKGEIIALEDAAKMTGYSADHLRRLCRARKVAHKKRGPYYYFTREHLRRFLPVDVEPVKEK